jgi:hypothetical protein
MQKTSALQQESLLSRKRAAEFLGVCKTTLDRLQIPKTVIRRRVLYRQTVLEQWIREHTEVKGGSHE